MSKAALLHDKQLIEYDYEVDSHKHIVGNIYKGKVVNVLRGMDAAFVDIGVGKNAFLYINDMLPANFEQQPKEKPSIHELVKVGQTIVVQVVKEAFGNKGARVTTHFSIPGRWLVYMPAANYIGISRKIEDESERTRLRDLMNDATQDGEGIIIRTAAKDEDEEALLQDLLYLRQLWKDMNDKKEHVKAPTMIYHELDLIPRFVRDLYTEHIDELIVNDKKVKEEIQRICSFFSKDLESRVKYEEHENLFQYYGVEEQIQKMFYRKVWLEQGGYIVIDHTEAMTVIDVNTGKFTGSKNLEQTVFQTNMEAASKIITLLRLRDIGGIIIVDFIDMEEEDHIQQITLLLEHGLQQDRTKSVVIGWTKLGLLEITRKKVRDHSFQDQVSVCSTCNGTGRLTR